MKVSNNEIKKEDLERIRELLINIDMVNGFIKFGSLSAPSIRRVVERQIELLKENENKDDAINIFVRDEHSLDSTEFNTYPSHCVKGTKEELVLDDFNDLLKNSYDIAKNNTNFMFAPKTIKLFESLPNLNRISIMGCLSEVCVKNGAIGARCYFDQENRNVEVGVYEDAIDTFDAPGHNSDEITQLALKDMESNGVKIYRKK